MAAGDRTRLRGDRRVLSPHAEVAVHDVRRDRIVGIWNPISARGRRALAHRRAAAHAEDAARCGPYPKVLADGRQVTSVSVVLHNAKGAPRGLLCLNFDRSPLDDMIDVLVRFAAPVDGRPAELFDKDWRDQISLVVAASAPLAPPARPPHPRAAARHRPRRLDQAGLFATRNAADHTATALGVSRTTVYSMLKEIR